MARVTGGLPIDSALWGDVGVSIYGIRIEGTEGKYMLNNAGSRGLDQNDVTWARQGSIRSLCAAIRM